MPEEVSKTTEARFAKLREMRERRDGPPPAPVAIAQPPPERDAEGKFVKKEEAATPPPAENDAAAAAAEKATADAAAAAAKAATDAAAAAEAARTATPVTEEIELEIDGAKQKVSVDPSLAAAFKKAEEVKQAALAAETAGKVVADREAMKAEIVSELEAQGKLVKPKSEAELAAERTIADAEREAKRPKEPAGDLLITNPEEWQKQNKAYQADQLAEAVARTKRETLAEVNQHQQRVQADAETQGRAMLREQFYETYPVLRDSAEMVDIILAKQIDTVIASGKIAKQLPPKEAQALKAATFAAVASEATKRLVKLMQGGKAVVPPAPPPPTVVSSAPVRGATPPKSETAPQREKYPRSSVSALLAEHKRSKEKGAA